MSSELCDDLPVQKAAKRTGGGRPRLRTAERGQVDLRVVSLEDLVPADHRMRLVRRLVEGLDLSAILARIKAVEDRPGHSQADPRILVALWLIATIERSAAPAPWPDGARRASPFSGREHEPQDFVEFWSGHGGCYTVFWGTVLPR